MKIKTMTLNGFRAFPTTMGPVAFEFDGKNALIYGENGAGKSSVFHALKEFFSLNPKPLTPFKNVFSTPQGVNNAVVQVTFDDQPSQVAPWKGSYHPASYSNQAQRDQRVVDAALRKSALDYRSLLDTNYKQGDGEINLFEILVSRVLADYQVTVDGRTPSIGELWKDLKQWDFKHANGRRWTENQRNKTLANEAASRLSLGLKQAIAALDTPLQSVLQSLGQQGIEVLPLQAPILAYRSHIHRDKRGFEGMSVPLNVKYKGHNLGGNHRPQHFLNEARLSALAIAIYLAGRLACVPTRADGSDDGKLKLLVLDDLLIGLDHSNRLPVLELLKTQFIHWQIVLLTHDKPWFEMAGEFLSAVDWVRYEIFEGDREAATPQPIVRLSANRPAQALLDKATALVNTPFIEASANYCRQAFEAALRGACQYKNVPLAYKQNPSEHKAQDLLNAMKKWARSRNDRALQTLIANLELAKNVVMNPYSHPSAPNIPKAEVVSAIDLVQNFINHFRQP